MLGLLFLPVKAAGRGTGETITACEAISCHQTLTVEEKIRLWAGRNGADPDLAVCIARLESGFNPSAKNPGSTAAGVFQFLRSTFNRTSERMGRSWTYDADVLDEDKNIEAGTWLLAHDGATHWVVWTNGGCR